ncbi:MAG: hypothetical protein CL573_09080 [Alphaproteobacteria bacterium]|nr:hypothetical protein [Alphaproteobacteria bacterium]HCP01598.1 hypothetical protein [Rhodospirillaceae bacterium]
MDVRVVQPIILEDGIDGILVWYSPPSGTKQIAPHAIARILFISPDRIQIVWRHGIDTAYLRAIGPVQTDNRDCQKP